MYTSALIMNPYLLQVMMGGEWFNELGDDPESVSTNDIVRIALDSLKDHLGISDEPSNVVARIHKVRLSG